MPTIESMLRTHPNDVADAAQLSNTVAALVECANVCTSCADACLGEDGVADLVTCIRRNLDCADICTATANALTRQVGDDATNQQALMTACAQVCANCADECEKHADMHEHCRVCAEACRRCEQACRELSAAA